MHFDWAVWGWRSRDLSSGRSWHTRITPGISEGQSLPSGALRGRQAAESAVLVEAGSTRASSGRASRTSARFKASFDENHAELDETRPESQVELVRGPKPGHPLHAEPNESRQGRAGARGAARRGAAHGALHPFQE